MIPSKKLVLALRPGARQFLANGPEENQPRLAALAPCNRARAVFASRRSDPLSTSARFHLRAFKQRPDIDAASTADLLGKLGLREANVIALGGGIYDDKVSATVVAAADQQPGRDPLRPAS